jgi:hypothetical protein
MEWIRQERWINYTEPTSGGKAVKSLANRAELSRAEEK